MVEQGVSRREALRWMGGLMVASARPVPPMPSMPSGIGGAQRVQGTPDSLVGELMDPTRAGKLRGRVTAYENDPFVVGVEEQLRCTCGCNLSVYTCRTTDFTCEISPAMHRRVVELVEQDQSAQQILDAFVAQYGESVLMAPPRVGFNLAGYLVPGILITLVGAVLAWLLVRRTRGRVAVRAAPVPGTRTPDPVSTLLPDEQARIKAELEKLGI